MVTIHGIEDYLLDQINKYNGIGCLVEDFIEQTHHFGMLDEKKKPANIRDRVKISFNHSKMESISNNGEVKLKIKQVRMQTRRKKTKTNDEISKQKIKRQNDRDECFENCMDNNEKNSKI